LVVIPGGFSSRAGDGKIGYKKEFLRPVLVCVGASAFCSSGFLRIYNFFLFALFVMACGQSF